MTTNQDNFDKNQKIGLGVFLAMATTLVAFAVVVATSLPVSNGLALSPLDAEEAEALASSSASAE